MKQYFQNGWDIFLKFLGACTAMLGMRNMRILWMLMALDFFTGVLLSFLNRSGKSFMGSFSWRACLKGIGKKCMMLAMVFLAGALDQLGGTHQILSSAAIGFYTIQEGISLAANAARFGVPLPYSLKRALENAKSNSFQREYLAD